MSAMFYNERNSEETYDFSEISNNLCNLEQNILKILYESEEHTGYEKHQSYAIGITTIELELLKLLPKVDKNDLLETINSLDNKGLTDELKSIFRCQMTNSGIEILKNRLSKDGKRFCESFFGNLDK